MNIQKNSKKVFVLMIQNLVGPKVRPWCENFVSNSCGTSGISIKIHANLSFSVTQEGLRLEHLPFTLTVNLQLVGLIHETFINMSKF